MTHAPSDEVRDNPARHRFELEADGHLAIAVDSLAPGVVPFIHTEVPDALAGRGIGSRLAKGALAQVRDRGLKVVPRCPFIRGYIEKHPEWQDLLA